VGGTVWEKMKNNVEGVSDYPCFYYSPREPSLGFQTTLMDKIYRVYDKHLVNLKQ
jgi:hypothetical protein